MKKLILILICALPVLAQVATINGTDKISDSRGVINGNFSWLDANKAASTHDHTGVYAPFSHVHLIPDISGLQAALDAKAPSANPVFTGNVAIGTTVLCSTIGTNAGTSLTLAAANNGCIARFTAGTDVAVTLNSDVAVAGFTILLVQRGAGAVIPTAGSGVTIRQRQSYTKTAGQYAIATLACDAVGDCILAGDLQ